MHKRQVWVRLDRTQLSANILFSLIEANPPNLIPTKFSSYK